MAVWSVALASPVPSERLAVLELHNPAGIEQQAADYLADRIRAAALSAAGARVRVLTRENVVALLPPGTDLAECADADCEVEMGRRLGAAFVVSGEVVRLGASLKLSLKLHGTADAVLLAAETASAEDVTGLEGAVPVTTEALLAKLPPRASAGPVALPAVPPLDPAAAVGDAGFGAVDLELLDRVQAALRLEGDEAATSSMRARAWAAVAERARGDRRDRAVERARQWQARAEAERARTEAARRAWDRYRADKAKLDRLLAYDDAVASAEQKAAWQAAFDSAYAPWAAEFAKMSAAVDWVRLDGGRFEWEASEGPVEVEPFWIGRTEVTVAQYAACVAAGGCSPIAWSRCTAGPVLGRPLAAKFGGDDQPAVCVDHGQAEAFARFVGGRLPTVTEWIYAARGGEVRDGFPWGRAPVSCERAVLQSETGYGCGTATTAPVCSRAKGNSAQGVCDLMGNAAEWTATTGAARVEAGTGIGRRRRPAVVGGSVVHATLDPRTIDLLEPQRRLPHVGFRVVKD